MNNDEWKILVQVGGWILGALSLTLIFLLIWIYYNYHFRGYW